MKKCAIENCGLDRNCRGFCNSHYHRLLRYGDPLGQPPSRPTVSMCTVDGCGLTPRSRTSPYCEKHYIRLYRNGTLQLQPKDYLRIREHTAGYKLLYSPNHPISTACQRSRVYEHRAVYYDAHGEGPFKCHWCGFEISWETMHVDHVDSNPSNNDISNLVASCPRCNAQRAKTKLRRTMRITFGIEHDGQVLTPVEWARVIGISYGAFNQRMKELAKRTMVYATSTRTVKACQGASILQNGE